MGFPCFITDYCFGVRLATVRLVVVIVNRVNAVKNITLKLKLNIELRHPNIAFKLLPLKIVEPVDLRLALS
jgi:hypothetical protein